MHPVLFDGVRAYPVSLFAAVGVGLWTVHWSGRRARVALPRSLWVCVLLIGVAGLTGAKLNALLQRGGTPYPFAWELQNSYRYPGAVIAITVAVLVLRRLRLCPIRSATLADVVAPAVALAMAVSRIGCFLDGCCYGVASDVPWAVQFPVASHAWNAQVAHGLISTAAQASLPVHPLQLYFALLAGLVGGFLVWFQRWKAYDGQVALFYLVLHEPGKYWLEFLRHDSVPQIQRMSLAFAVLAGIALLTRAMGVRKPRPSTALSLPEEETPAAGTPVR